MRHAVAVLGKELFLVLAELLVQLVGALFQLFVVLHGRRRVDVGQAQGLAGAHLHVGGRRLLVGGGRRCHGGEGKGSCPLYGKAGA